MFADRVSHSPFVLYTLFHYNRLILRSPFFTFSLQRFARADKRAKLPKWINQYIAETATNLSTDMAIGEFSSQLDGVVYV